MNANTSRTFRREDRYTMLSAIYERGDSSDVGRSWEPVSGKSLHSKLPAHSATVTYRALQDPCP